MIESRKRKGMELYELHEMRNVVKEGGIEVMSNLKNRFKELKIEGNREKETKTYFMGKESASRWKYHEQRRRGESQERDWQRGRKESQGKGNYQDRRWRDDSRGRPFFRRDARDFSRDRRDFSRDRRSFSRNRDYRRNSSRGDDKKEEDRSKSRERSDEEKGKCIVCQCEVCKKRQKKTDEIKVNLCAVGDSCSVNYVAGDNQVLVIDMGAPVSLVGKKWVERYTEENGLDHEDMNIQNC